MSDEPRPDEHGPDEPRGDVVRTKATVRRGWAPGWIWAIPLAALLVLGWWLVRIFMAGGEDVTIAFDDVHGLKASDTNVVYRGMNVGKVSGIKLNKDGTGVEVTVHIQDDATRFLTSGTQFWLRGAQPDLSDPASLTAVLSGPTVMMDPGPGQPTTRFTGLARKPVARGVHDQPQTYRVSLQGAVGGLEAGAPVKLRGFAVGEVKAVEFRYDAGSGQLETPVTLALYPSLLHIQGGSTDGATALAAAIDRLVGQGLQASLKRDPPLIGTAEVSLDIRPGDAGATPGMVNGVREIPAAPGGGLDSIVARVDKLPLDQIAQNILAATRHLDDVVGSPQLKDAVGQLDATLGQIHKAADSAGPEIPKLVDRLRQTAAQIEAAAKSAQNTVQSANRVVGGASTQTGIQTATREITDAARSVRDLANYLNEHPEAMVEGRKGE